MMPRFRCVFLLFFCSIAERALSQDVESGRSRRDQPGVLPWKFPTGDLQDLNDEIPVRTPGKFHVVSSSLRVLPRKKEHNRNRRSESDTTELRKPRRHQFVTTSRMGKYLDPDPLRYYPEDRHPYSYQDYPRRSAPQRRIIYYATLPEIVRRPVDWDAVRGSASPGYPPIHENEVVTRVQSPVIDVTNEEKYKIRGAYSAPKITIIDVDPPYRHYHPDNHYRYHRQPSYYPPGRHDFPSPPYVYQSRPPFSDGPAPYHEDDYRHRLPSRHIIVPPLPNGVTVFRRKPSYSDSAYRDQTTRKPPTQHDFTTTTHPPTTLAYERHYKY